jgi:hypothetical protein
LHEQAEGFEPGVLREGRESDDGVSVSILQRI